MSRYLKPRILKTSFSSWQKGIHFVSRRYSETAVGVGLLYFSMNIVLPESAVSRTNTPPRYFQVTGGKRKRVHSLFSRSVVMMWISSCTSWKGRPARRFRRLDPFITSSEFWCANNDLIQRYSTDCARLTDQATTSHSRDMA